MYNVIVLGFVPGTNVQISFQAWLAITIGLPVLFLISRSLIQWLASVRHASFVRLPLPANQLHLRIRQTAR